MSKTMPILLAFGLISGPALAAQSEMICKSPFRSYLAAFDDEANTFKLATAGEVTPYQVNKVDKGPDGTVLRGKTVKGGPDFAAYFGKKRRIEFIDGGEVIQTDLCK